MRWFVALCFLAGARGVLLPRSSSSPALFLASTTTSARGENAATKVIDNLKASFGRLLQGFQAIPGNFQRQQQLKKLRKDEGDSAISYADFKFLENAAEDVSKILRAGLFCAVSPEYFFYSYLVIPMMSGASNPWAWRTLPSGFDTEADKSARDRIVAQRRQAALVTALSHLFSGCAEDVDAKLRDKRIAQLSMIERAMGALGRKGFGDALEVLQPWLESSRGSSGGGSSGSGSGTPATPAGRRKAANKPTPAAALASSSTKPKLARAARPDKLDIPEVPWTTIKDCCKAIGVDGVPNFYLVRLINRGELSRHFELIRAGDEYLKKVGVARLHLDEVVDACVERCISTDTTRSDAALRADLTQWVAMATAPVGPQGVAVNAQNRRLALAGLHVCRDVKTGALGGALKAVLQS